jgi:hypothetical protein
MHSTATGNNYVTITKLGEPGSSESIVPDYGLDDRVIEVRYPAEARGFSSNLCQDRLSGPPSLLSNECPGSFLRR